MGCGTDAAALSFCSECAETVEFRALIVLYLCGNIMKARRLQKCT